MSEIFLSFHKCLATGNIKIGQGVIWALSANTNFVDVSFISVVCVEYLIKFLTCACYSLEFTAFFDDK